MIIGKCIYCDKENEQLVKFACTDCQKFFASEPEGGGGGQPPKKERRP